MDDDEEGVCDEMEFAMRNHVCPKCGFHLDLVRGEGGSALRCCNVKCRWEMSLFGSFESLGKDGGRHVFSKKDLTFLRSCARTCLDCGFLCWCNVHKFYCKLNLPLTVLPCSRFVERVSR